jgi:hypothetical protein
MVMAILSIEETCRGGDSTLMMAHRTTSNFDPLGKFEFVLLMKV